MEEIKTSFGMAEALHGKGEAISNGNICIIGQIGSGKSIALEKIAENFYHNGYTIINVRDEKGNLEGASCAFKPTAKYHMEKLKISGEEEIIQGYPTKIYHPLILSGIPNKLIPETIFYTIDLKSLSAEEIAFLLSEETETTASTLFLNTIKELKKDEGFYDLLHLAFNKLMRKHKKIGSEKIYRADPKKAFLPLGEGKITNLNTIYQKLEIIEKYYYFLTPSNYGYNLNILDILNDNKHYHIFTTRYIQDTKIKHFFAFWLMNQIYKNRLKKKKSVLIIFDEIRMICPKNPKDYKKIMVNLVKEMMSVVRNSGISTISTTQVYQQVDDDLISSYSDIYIGNTVSTDIDFVKTKYNLSKDLANKILRLKKGEFLNIRAKNIVETLMPYHAHFEENDNFDETWEKNYPDKMKNNYFLTQELKRLKDEEYNRIGEKAKLKELEEEKKAQEREQKKLNQENRSFENNKQKEENKEKKKIDKGLRDKLIGELYQKHKEEHITANKIRLILKEQYNMLISASLIKNKLKELRGKDVQPTEK